MRTLVAALMGVVVVSGVLVLMLARPSRVDRFGRTRPVSVVVLGLVTVGLVVSCVVDTEQSEAVSMPTTPPAVEQASLSTVLQLVAASSTIRRVPPNLTPSLSEATTVASLGIPPGACWPSTSVSTVPACAFGDTAARRTVVLYGDSHAGMWFDALDDIAKRTHWRLVVLTKGSCPAIVVSVQPVGGKGDWAACDQWHRFALARIAQVKPAMVVVSEASYYGQADGQPFSSSQWGRAVRALLGEIPDKKVVLGNIPYSDGPVCLSHHTASVQACSLPSPLPLTGDSKAEEDASKDFAAQYVDVTPWFCTRQCSSVIGNYDAYYLTNHVTLAYSRFLEGVLAAALHLAA